MKSEPPFSYYSSVVEIIDERDITAGVGVILDDVHVLTCAHVVAQCLIHDPDASADRLPANATIGIRRTYIDGRDSRPLIADLKDFHGRCEASSTADLALLKLRGAPFPIDGYAEIETFSESPLARGEVTFALGFPEDAAATRGGVAEAEYLVGGPQPNLWVGLTDTRGYGSEIRAGFSGAPVWSGAKNGIVGLITEADSVRRTATVIPTRLLKLAASIPVIGIPASASPSVDAPVPTPRRELRLGSFRRLLEWALPPLHYWLTVRLGCLPDPPEREVFSRYLHDEAAKLSSTLYEKTYIPPVAAEPHAGPLLSRGSSFTSPIHQLIRGLSGSSQGGDAASAQISAMSKRSHRINRLMNELMALREPLILLGEPGSGKSITLLQTMMLLSRKNAHRVLPYVCIYLPLGKLAPVDSPTILTIERFVYETCPPSLRPYLNHLERLGRLILIFDGMDEMSREKYIEHTGALSAYAESRREQARTLFSCRIADFSPNFRHRRLLLLPFDVPHIAAYLRRQFGTNRIELDKKLFKPKALAKIIFSDDVTIQAGNPFVLWLLCLYIHETHTSPTNRTTLLEYYYRYMISLKEKLPAHENVFQSAPEDLFDLWGRVAREITERNQGSEISLQALSLNLGQNMTVGVTTGRICGVLQQSIGGSATKLRFEHHRAQEFFTAWDLVRDSGNFDWADRLDTPRWQETLVNVAQLGSADEAIGYLSEILDKTPGQLQGAEGDEFQRLITENLIAERVEVSARIARELPAGELRETFWSKIELATRSVLDLGSAVSKVKMVRVVQQNAGRFSPADLAPAIKDESTWVRDQAYTVATQLSNRIGESPLPLELLYAFTTGRLPKRLPAFFSMAKKIGRLGVFAICLIGCLLALLETSILAGLGIWAQALVRTELWLHPIGVTNSEVNYYTAALAHIVISDWYNDVFILCMLMVALICAFRFAPVAWIILSSLAAVFILGPLLIGLLWASELSIGAIFAGLTALVLIGAVVIGVLAALGAAVWMAITLVYSAVVSLWAADRSLIRAGARSAWDESGARDGLSCFLVLLYPIGYGIFIVGYERLLQILAELRTHVTIDPALSAYNTKLAQVLELRRQERTG